MRARFAKVPMRVLSDASLLPSAVRIYAAIDSFADNRTRLAYPSYEKIAARSASTPATVKRAIRELERAGHIEVTRRPNRSHVYRLLDGGSPVHPQGDTDAPPTGTPMPPELNGSSHTHPLGVPGRFAPSGAPVAQGTGYAVGVATGGDLPVGENSAGGGVFDALCEISGARPAGITQSQRSAIRAAESQILRVAPGVTPDEIRRRAATYVRLHPTWSLTPRALAKYWGSLETGYTWTPGGAGDPSGGGAPPPASTPHLSPRESPTPARAVPQPNGAPEPARRAPSAPSRGDPAPDTPTPAAEGLIDVAPTPELIYAEMKETLEGLFRPAPGDP